MDIHKPKPWHGVREFLKEYVIIVVGVLTALGAEAIVENLHEKRLSAEARTSVRDELNLDIASVSVRLKQEACYARRLGEIGDLLDTAEAGAAFAPARSIGGPASRVVYTQRWEAATAGGRTSLLSSDEQRSFARTYSALGRVAGLMTEERQTWMRLRALKGLKRLSPEMIYGQRIALSQARDLDFFIREGITQAQFYARQIGVTGDAKLLILPGAARPVALPSICVPMTDAPPPGSGDASEERAHGHP